MYDFRSNLVIGFHGCDASVFQKLLLRPNEIKISTAPYDWLGSGMYFWENNYERACKWARQKQEQGIIQEPAVIGAVISLNYCCDLLDQQYVSALEHYYELFRMKHRDIDMPIPENIAPPGTLAKDRVVRKLDCSVIEFMHEKIMYDKENEIAITGHSSYRLFDSVRGVFIEGPPIYEGAGFYEDTHIQICIRNPNCILGFFHPRTEINFHQHLQQQKSMLLQ